MEDWFEDLEGRPVLEGCRPVGKIYVVDPLREWEADLLTNFLDPAPWELIVRTNVASLEGLAAHAQAYPSRSEARKNGFSGSPYHGLEMYGPLHRSFWIFCPTPPKVAPTLSRKKLRTTQYWDFLRTMGWDEPLTYVLGVGYAR